MLEAKHLRALTIKQREREKLLRFGQALKTHAQGSLTKNKGVIECWSLACIMRLWLVLCRRTKSCAFLTPIPGGDGR